MRRLQTRAALLLTVLLVACTSPLQPKLGTRTVAVLTVDGGQFRDLNKNGELDPYEDWRRPATERAEDLLARMTLPEKAGLMVHPALNMGENGTLFEQSDQPPPSPLPGAGGPPLPPEQRRELQELLRMMNIPTTETILTKNITHVLTRSAEKPEIIATWNNNLQELAESGRLGIPVTISSDPRHGFRHDPEATSVRAGAFSQWPEPLGLAATADPELVREFGSIASTEYRAVGIRTALHPMADLATEPRWGRIIGTFGEDAELSARLSAAYIRGFQGEGGLGPESVATMTKHFPGGGPQLDGLDPHSDYGKEQVYPGGNLDYHLIPFQAAIEAGAAQIMPYYGIPMDITGENVAMAYNKEIITGMLRQKLGFDGVVCSDWLITTRMAWGVEDLSVAERYRKAIEAGIDQFGGDSTPEIIVGLVEQGTVEEARIDRSVHRILRGKFRLGLFENPYVDARHAAEIVGSDAFQAAADIAQRKSIVLLRNDVLPLAEGAKIYVENINPDAASEYGAVTGNLDEADVAIVRIKTAFETRPGFFGWIPSGNLATEGEELAHLQKVMRAKPTVVSIFMDRPAVIPEVATGAAALLATFGASDRAVLDIIFGKFNPTGKLPFELPSSMEAVDRQKEDVPYDSQDPLFDFGFGLSF